ncbi:MAG TPA: helix-turn-helix transcriptional regulator [Thermomicrobiales bacterium]|jgi:transcriptional regulator with XRE-family HTH domain|nr:helix-turn-helix transcriptional regulator [Thermomicrobiales bacterium]
MGGTEKREATGSALGSWIRERRMRRRLSQKDLAAHAKISRSYLCDIEQGRGTQPSLHVLQSIARSLGEDPAELMMQAGVDIDRADDLHPGSHRERRVLTMFRALSPAAQETIERFTRFLHDEEHRYIQPTLTPIANRPQPTAPQPSLSRIDEESA